MAVKLRVLSDLHLEHLRDPSDANIHDNIDCDVVVLGGDIGLGTDGIEWAAANFETPVVYVMGNHEYYNYEMTSLIARARACARELGIHLLENDEVVINGQRFLGCTLWSGFDTGPYGWLHNTRYAHSRIADFSEIRCGERLFNPSRMIERYKLSHEWLSQALDESNPAVLVTHFAPTLKAINPEFGPGDELTPYFHNDLEDLMGAAAPIWIYGHNHYSDVESIEREFGTTLVASN